MLSRFHRILEGDGQTDPSASEATALWRYRSFIIIIIINCCINIAEQQLIAFDVLYY